MKNMKKSSLLFFVLSGLLICLCSCSYQPDFPIGNSSDYEEIHNWGPVNPLFKGKGYYDVGYCPDGVYKKYNTSCYFEIMENGELYYKKSTFKSGLISVYKKSKEEKSYYNMNLSNPDHARVKKGDLLYIKIEMEPYFTTKKNEKFYEFSIYLGN